MFPELDDFYSGSTEYDDAHPGDILRFERMRARLAPGIDMPARAWRIVYRTTGALGQPSLSSGVVLVPRRPGPRPLLGFAVGTQGLGIASAASLHLRAGIEYEAPVVIQALRRGGRSR